MVLLPETFFSFKVEAAWIWLVEKIEVNAKVVAATTAVNFFFAINIKLLSFACVFTCVHATIISGNIQVCVELSQNCYKYPLLENL